MKGRIALACMAAAALAGAPAAQAPKVGNDWYQDNVDLGFKIKVPKGWELTPPSPSEDYMIAKYTPPRRPYVLVSGDRALFLHYWLVEFDNRPDTTDDPAEAARRRMMPKLKDVHEWIPKNLLQGREWRYDKEDYPEELKGADVPAESYVYSAVLEAAPEERVNAYVAVFEFGDERRVALVGEGPGDKKWRSYESAFEKMAKSLTRVEVEALAAVEGSAPRDLKRAELEVECAKAGDWQLYETDNYFIVSNNEDEDFIEELMVRLEAIRAVYGSDYPADKARKTLNKKEPAETADDEPERPERSVSAVDPMERSRTSVVRVCKNQTQYQQYGGPSGSAGYWNSGEEELVVYDDKMEGGRGDTWATLNHEAFHQYIFYFYGNIAPHSWYNEGTGDYYAGFDYKLRKFKRTEFSWRKTLAKEVINTRRYVPLQEFVRWTQREYYGQNERQAKIGDNYAQGWSFVYFLRTGPEENLSGWDDSWNTILDTYLETLAVTGDLDAAVDKAFEGVDWEDLEEAWKKAMG